VGAISRSETNVIHSPNEKTGGERPIDLIGATRPVVIVDEPQSVDGGLKVRGRKALASMKPLCTLRYSATHVDRRNMVYRLDAVAAYERGLVKEIEVASAKAADGADRPYVRLVGVKRSGKWIVADVEMNMADAEGVSLRRKRVVFDGDDLALISGIETYRGIRIGEIRLKRGGEMELCVPGNYVWLATGEAYGAPDSAVINREMVRRTIKEHLDKEKRLAGSGVKVLSLFFIDKVDRYREYLPDGSVRKGEYALLFEEEYRRLAQHSDYRSLFGRVEDLQREAERAHDGYFSADSGGKRWVDTEENTQGNRERAERAYNLIMRDKEELLSIDNPLRFIFSHSALREGWDNPNVFQICALREMHGEIERRQTLGRGLRLCVNREGERIRDRSINTLTVIAKESYEEYAAHLQSELEEQTGIRFGVVSQDRFASLRGETGDALGEDQSAQLWRHLHERGYLDLDSRVSARLRRGLKDWTVELPAQFEPLRAAILRELKLCAGGIKVRNADERRKASPRRAVLDSAEFRELWERVKHKTTYRVRFDNEKLIRECSSGLKRSPPIPPANLSWEIARMHVESAGVSAELRKTSAPINLPDAAGDLPDLLTELQNLTQLTRKSVARILQESGRIADFRRSPRRFIEAAARIIRKCKLDQIKGGVKYRRLGDEHFYSRELFETKELVGYLRNMLSVEKAAFDCVICDSDTEREFARRLEQSEAVKVYAKLPDWFRIPTPLGAYIPDWALLIKDGKKESLYFVAETKGSPDDLRQSESDKIAFGEKHFEALRIEGDCVRYVVVRNFDELLARAV